MSDKNGAFKDGYLVDEKGDFVLVDGQKILVQPAIDSVVKGEKKKTDKALQDRIDELTEKTKSSLPADEAQKLRTEIETLKSQLSTEAQAAQRAKSDADRRIEEARAEERKIAEKHLQRARENALRADVVSAASGFRDPNDALRFLRDNLEWVPVLGDDEKPTGEEVPRFRMRVPHPTEKEKEIERLLTPQEAIGRLRETHAYLLAGNPRGGAPVPSGTRPLNAPADVSKLSPTQKLVAAMEQEAAKV